MANCCIILPSPPLCQRKEGNPPLFQQHILSPFPFDLLHMPAALALSMLCMLQQRHKMRLKKSEKIIYFHHDFHDIIKRWSHFIASSRRRSQEDLFHRAFHQLPLIKHLVQLIHEMLQTLNQPDTTISTINSPNLLKL